MKSQKKRCWTRGSLDVVRWSKQLNKQRFKCKNGEILSRVTIRSSGLRIAISGSENGS